MKKAGSLWLKLSIAALLAAVFALALPLAAGADLIPEPDNDFYRRHFSGCTPLQRSFYANGRSGSVSLRAEPGAKNEGMVFENGTELFIMYTYNNGGEIWGVTEIWETGENGWLPMVDLLLVYDHISFAEDHLDEFYTYSGVYEALKTIPDLIFWTWPGSGEIDSILESKWRSNSEHEAIFLAGDKPAYKGADGLEWVFIPYLFGRRDAWICLGDPMNMDIPASNPAPEPELWQPGEAHLEPAGGLPLPMLAIILVVCVAAATAVLIRVFWKKEKVR